MLPVRFCVLLIISVNAMLNSKPNNSQTQLKKAPAATDIHTHTQPVLHKICDCWITCQQTIKTCTCATFIRINCFTSYLQAEKERFFFVRFVFRCAIFARWSFCFCSVFVVHIALCSMNSIYIYICISCFRLLWSGFALNSFCFFFFLLCALFLFGWSQLKRLKSLLCTVHPHTYDGYSAYCMNPCISYIALSMLKILQ